ncbi:MAG TPA: glycosyltransferase [Candidatus Babeliales bacterium]|nr:glycosyltransferase [Candidatus Babeliales bacterium]
MRIFFVTNNYTPYSGGVIQSITATTNALRKQGHYVFIITLNFLGKKHDDPDYVIRIPCPIKFMYKKNHMAIPWRPTHAITTLIKKHKPDIVHIHHPFLLGASALRAARKHSIPCVFTYHTMYEHYAHYVPLPQVCLQPIIRTTVHRFCNKVDAIIAPSTNVKNYLVSHNITAAITIIPSPLRECFTGFTTTKTQTKKSQYFELLLVSRFVPEKNIPFVFDVIQLLPNNFRLILVGYGADYKKLQVLAFDTLQLCPTRVRFIHKPTLENLLALYCNADLFIFPSQTDTQGIVLAESMSQGVPVVALDGPGQRDIIMNGINGFIVESAKDAAEKIIAIEHNPVLLQQLQYNSFKTGQRYYSATIIKQLVEFYTEQIS